jgi:hypothetical protein
LVAKKYDLTRRGLFVFISAEPSILPMLSKYSDLKLEAELFLKEKTNLDVVIIRPGLIYS